MASDAPLQEFERILKLPESRIDLAEAAMQIARTEYPQLDVPSQLARLDRLADGLDCNPSRPPLENIRDLNELLFVQQGFAGNMEDYDDPRNSFLNDVLERKKGIPITLSLVYAEVARRRSLPIVGVSFPGHFIVKYVSGPKEILIDPFAGGAVWGQLECEEKLKSHFGEKAEMKREYLLASTPRQILSRMLNNLKATYFRRQAYTKVLTMIDFSLAIDPASSGNIRDRGMIYFTMRRYREAAVDFNAYLNLALPNDPEAVEVMKLLRQVRGIMN